MRGLGFLVMVQLRLRKLGSHCWTLENVQHSCSCNVLLDELVRFSVQGYLVVGVLVICSHRQGECSSVVGIALDVTRGTFQAKPVQFWLVYLLQQLRSSGSVAQVHDMNM